MSSIIETIGNVLKAEPTSTEHAASGFIDGFQTSSKDETFFSKKFHESTSAFDDSEIITTHTVNHKSKTEMSDVEQILHHKIVKKTEEPNEDFVHGMYYSSGLNHLDEDSILRYIVCGLPADLINSMICADRYKSLDSLVGGLIDCDAMKMRRPNTVN
jgi:hypothetical protein